MNRIQLRLTVLAALIACPAIGFAADEPATPPPTNKLERFQVKHANCHWTTEMGNYMFECLKANFNMNAHWCHNEAMDAFCPVQEDAGKAAEAPPPAGDAKQN